MPASSASGSASGSEVSAVVRIPADVDMEDRVLGRLTARQVAILAAAAAVFYLIWLSLRAVVPVLVLLAALAPVAVIVAVLALGSRDGITMDRFAFAAARQWASTCRPHHHTGTGTGVGVGVPRWLSATARPVPVPVVAGAPRLPVRAPAPPARQVRGPVTRGAEVGGAEVGIVDLGSHGLAAVAVCSTVSFALRTPREQAGLCGVFGAFLNAIAAPVQILVRAVPIELDGHIDALTEAAAAMPHPALAVAALDHAAHLGDLTRDHDLLRRQVLLIVREPHPGGPTTGPATGPATGGQGQARRAGLVSRLLPALFGSRPPTTGRPNAGVRGSRAVVAAETRLVRRIAEARDLLAPAGIVVVALDTTRATAILSAACHPGGGTPASDPADITTGDLTRGWQA